MKILGFNVTYFWSSVK